MAQDYRESGLLPGVCKSSTLLLLGADLGPGILSVGAVSLLGQAGWRRPDLGDTMDALCHIIAFVSHWSSGAPSVGDGSRNSQCFCR